MEPKKTFESIHSQCALPRSETQSFLGALENVLRLLYSSRVGRRAGQLDGALHGLSARRVRARLSLHSLPHAEAGQGVPALSVLFTGSSDRSFSSSVREDSEQSPRLQASRCMESVHTQTPLICR